jgi:hypothetical protein
MWALWHLQEFYKIVTKYAQNVLYVKLSVAM